MTTNKQVTLKLIMLIALIGSANMPKALASDKIDSLFTSLVNSKAFNGVVLVSSKGKSVYHNSFGYANLEQKLTKEHQFNIGSIYKELPAIAIMQLQERGKLDINDKLSEHLPDLPSWGEKVSLKSLLQYTGGLPKISWGKHKIISNEALLKDLQYLDTLHYTPDSNYLYTNYSPFLLAKIVEKTSGEQFTSFDEHNITNPLGMTQRGFRSCFPYKEPASKAIPFNDEFEEDRLPFTITSELFLFTTTAKDLLKLANGLHSEELINKNSLEIISKTSELKKDDLQAPLGNVVLKMGR